MSCSLRQFLALRNRSTKGRSPKMKQYMKRQKVSSAVGSSGGTEEPAKFIQPDVLHQNVDSYDGSFIKLSEFKYWWDQSIRQCWQNKSETLGWLLPNKSIAFWFSFKSLLSLPILFSSIHLQ